MRLLLVLAAAALALVAWLALSPRRETARMPREEQAGAPAKTERPATTLDVAPDAGAPRRAPEVASANEPAAAATSMTRIRGRVVDENGYGIGGATVSLREWASFPEVVAKHETQSGHNGAFELEVPTPATAKQSLLASAEPFHAPKEIWFGLETSSGKHPLGAGEVDAGELVLPSCGRVEGRVITDRALPVEGVWVRLLADGRDAEGASTDASGRFVVEHVRPGRCLVTIHDEAWLPPEKVFVDVVGLRLTPAPDLFLTRAPTITGVVVDADGTPLSNVSVAGGTAFGKQLTYATSLPDGTFEMRLPIREPMVLSVRAQREFMEYECPPDGAGCTFQPDARGVRIVLQRAPRMTFRVVDGATSEAIERFGIRLRRLDGEDRLNNDVRRLDVVFHEGGMAELAIAARSWVEVDAPGFARAKLQVAGDPTRTAVQTIALEPGSSITGRVVVDGKPAAGASVLAMQGPRKIEGKQGAKAFSMSSRPDLEGQWDTKSNEQGEFTIADLAADVFALQIRLEGNLPKTIDDLVLPRAGVLALGDIELARGATLRGIVRTAEGDSPEGFMIVVDGGFSTTIRTVDGRFEMTGLPPGRRTLRWSRQMMPYVPHLVDVDLVAGQTREIEIDATASAPCTLHVTVRRHGQPAVGMPVVAQSTTERAKGTAYLGVTNAQGIASGKLEGGARFTVQALSVTKRPIGATTSAVTTIAGAELACEIDVASGTLSLELPAEVVRPENGRVRLQFADGTWLDAVTKSGSPRDPREFVPGELRWSTNRIDFGEVPAGRRDAEVRIERFERTPGTDNPKLGTWVPLHPPFKTHIDVRDGEATHVVVP